jgi:hypothetical protein
VCRPKFFQNIGLPHLSGTIQQQWHAAFLSFPLDKLSHNLSFHTIEVLRLLSWEKSDFSDFFQDNNHFLANIGCFGEDTKFLYGKISAK